MTSDENGDFEDHASPPTGSGWEDLWQPGSRIPALVSSPFARKGHIEKPGYETTSILKLMTKRFDLAPPGGHAKAGDLTEALAMQ